MSRAYSDHFNSNTIPGVAAALTDLLPLDKQRRIGAGVGHARLRKKVARAVVPTAGMTDNDELRLMQFKSGDRIFDIRATGLTESATYAADLGLYKSGLNHDGAAIDEDLFATALAFGGGALGRTEAFTEGELANIHRGRPLWYLANVGAGTYTKDPMEDWDLVLTSTATGVTASETMMIEVEYTSGD